jgi:polyisoprenoid-binding protein YceI
MKIFLSFIFAVCLCACSQPGAQAQAQAQAQVQVQSSETVEVVGVAVDGAAEYIWDVDAEKSSIDFTGSQGGEAFTGSFSTFKADIVFDPKDLAASHVRAEIDLASVEAGDAERTEALPGKDWFFIKSFPVAIFEAKAFTALENNQYEAVGHLTLKGITRELVLPFSLTITDGHADMKAHISLDRTTFNVGTGMWKGEDWVAHKVDIDILLSAQKR